MAESLLPVTQSETCQYQQTQGNARSDKEGFRIQKVVNVVFCVLAAAFAATALIAFYASVLLISPILAVVAKASLVALAVLFAVKVWHHVEPYMPNFIRVPVNYIHGAICGIISSIALAALTPLNLAKKNPTKEECDPNQDPICLVHGFMGSSNNMLYHRYRLMEAGFKNVFTLNLGNLFLSNDDYARKIHELVLEIKERTGRSAIDFISHSNGYLAVNRYIELYSEQDEIEVPSVISLGAPKDGTFVAWATVLLGFMSKAGRELFPGSRYVRNLQRFARSNTKTLYYQIASKCDLVVRPIESAVALEGPHVKTEWLDCVSHVSMLFSDTAADMIIRFLQPGVQSGCYMRSTVSTPKM